MAIKLVDELKAMGNFPIAYAEGINLVKKDGTEDNLQNLFDNGELGGGGDSSVTLTQQEYESLTEEEKLDGLYYAYDTKRIYKNGVQYGSSDAEDIGYNNAESGIHATTVQGVIDKVVEKVDGLISDTSSSTTSTWSSNKIGDEIAKVDTELKESIEKINSNLGDKADTDKVVPKITITDTTTADAKTIIEKNWSTFPAETSTATIVTSNYGYNALINKQGKYGTVTLTTPVNGEPLYYGVLGGSSWTWYELATMDKAFKHSGLIEANITSGYVQTNNPLGVECNIICSKMYISGSSPDGLSVTGQTTNKHINIYVRNADGTLPPDGTSIKIAFILF